VDLNGLLVADAGTDSFSVTSSTIVSTGDYAVFATSTNTSVVSDFQYSISDFQLGNAGDEIMLSASNSGMIAVMVDFDSVEYDTTTFPTASGISLNLDPDLFAGTTLSADNDSGTNWCLSTSTYANGNLGTPGLANDSCATEDCTNGVDDDGDGLADCLDADCDGLNSCEMGTELSCNDNIDNDGDIDQDCDDSDCTSDPVCSSPPVAVTYDTDIAPLLANCGGCHGSSGGLTMSYANLVGVASNQLSSMNRVEASDPANSYLLHKIADGETINTVDYDYSAVGGSGSSMLKHLSLVDLELIESWIAGGALEN
jgi:hypothetical protein